ncbi:hypothetical protein GHT06_016020 [Daphnia sinensis]|uniref:Methyltransferase FkbM domain-containing protein n=1 Tax=Daphnia sinensis TaxID=1820382 RepID=A0AAD5PTD9_9CRUS|nr:hypothetical protein GHT06_016020 [Daphnia sinensis]
MMRSDFRLMACFLALTALLLPLFYVFGIVKVESNFVVVRTMAREHQFKAHQQNATSNTESLPITYNLMEETYGPKWNKDRAAMYLSSNDCTMDYANAQKLQQDHPCVIQLIRRYYLHQPASKSFPYQMDHPEIIDPSDGQSKVILKILQKKRRGFFVEVGAFDGEFLSNTLFMERSLQWSGLLIEADKKAYDKLLKRNRKAFTSPVCLSTKPYPMQVIYNGSISSGSFIIDQEDSDGHVPNEGGSATTVSDSEDVYTAQCFPLYSLLLAVGRTRVDYFGLDVEGSEYKILNTIPWHKVYMQTLTVEWNHAPEGEASITRLMEDNNFIKFGLFSMPYSREVVYVQDFLYGYRIFGDPEA